ncbi:MAG: glycolate oxidase subunit GlcE [Gammaproteobacteria bacterium]
MSQDIATSLQERIREAADQGTPINIVGGDSKRFLGRPPEGEPLPVGGHRGVVRHEPSELVLTARAGSLLTDIESTLAEAGQMLAFEPPHFGDQATLGGAIASGLSGPRRPYAGSARDFVLGCQIINGKGEVLRFGGEVMKNVAGYDLSRLMTGAFGTLGVLLEISLKVLPLPAAQLTLVQHRSADEALQALNGWAAKSIPLSGGCFDGDRLYVRLSGAEKSVAAGRERVGGEVLDDGDEFWRRLREQRHGFFDGDRPLWRIAVAPATPELPLSGKWLLDWGGAQRWLRSDEPAQRVWEAARSADGHATLYRGGDRTAGVFQPLTPGVAALHRRLKQAFDPKGILNPGRMYADL